MIKLQNLSITVSRCKKSDIQKQATQSLSSVSPELPIPIIAIAEHHGLKVHEVSVSTADDVHTSAILTKDNDSWLIIVNEAEPPTRKRFSIAHELGHYVLHGQQEFIDDFSGGEIFYRQNVSQSAKKGSAKTAAQATEQTTRQTTHQAAQQLKQEQEANYFAACLLMPETEVRRVWPETRTALATAEKFYVSESAMLYRLLELGLIESVPGGWMEKS